MEVKRIKDPIYGYISIEENFVGIINSSNFQRLRDIIQTSYTSLYPSSLHNRFTHSLGVFHLGKIAIESLINNSLEIVESIDKNMLENIKKTFLFACLCHDLGHSPFSHTGEVFYNPIFLSKELKKEINNEIYSSDLQRKGGSVGKEHEIMSALLTLRTFPDFIEQDYYDFFARCIIGLKYSDINEQDNISLFKQSCIEMLNSNIIDVDKLDYLIRDSYMSGYDSVTIDYKRLLEGIKVYNNQNYPICYNKSSLSVLESVLTAHDLEKRWLQSHPTVLYESFLIKTIIKDVDSEYLINNESLLNYDSLTKEGFKVDKIGSLKFLSDSDILFLAKLNSDKHHAVNEYLDRNLRRHPIWKSEAEYNILFEFKNDSALFDVLSDFEKTLENGSSGTYSINDIFYNYLLSSKAILEDKFQTMSKQTEKNTIDSKIKTIEKEILFIEKLKSFFEKENMPFDLVIVTLKQFKRNIFKNNFQELPIEFPELKLVKKMKEISSKLLDIEDEKRFFYFYYKRNNGDKPFKIIEFSKILQNIYTELKY